MKQGSFDAFTCDESLPIVDAMGMIDVNRSGTLFVVDPKRTLLGAVTDGDIRRWILKAGNLKEPVRTIMNPNPKYLFQGQESLSDTIMKSNHIRAIPIVDLNIRVIDIINHDDVNVGFKDDAQLLKDVPVVIMAGGKGTRLYPYTKILPKPLIPIGETPIVERIINKFVECGVSHFYMSVNYKKEMIKSYFSEIKANYRIEYVEEKIPLGTAGSIKLIKNKFDRSIFVINCDTIIITDYNVLYKHHLDAGDDITVVTALKNITVPYGVIHSDSMGKIDHMEEKPKHSYFINTGLYVLNPSTINLIPDDKEYHMTDLVDAVIQNGGSVGVFPISEDSFLDMGEFGEMKRMEEKLNIAAN